MRKHKRAVFVRFKISKVTREQSPQQESVRRVQRICTTTEYHPAIKCNLNLRLCLWA
jgi:hypothetical protein